ncbi:MAG: efflux RND transporter periplasmic adaptor subunit [Candidatus Sulfotelmatobacter sp.]
MWRIATAHAVERSSPVEQFDITGLFEFSETLPTLDEMHKIVLDVRPDLKAAMEAVDKAQTDHKLAMTNGSTDPTFGFDFGRNPPIDAYFRVSVNLPRRCHSGPGVQRRRLRLRNFEQQSDPAATSEDKVFSTSGPSSGQHRFFLSEWLRVAARLSQRRERVPHGSDQLREPDRFLPDPASQLNFAVGSGGNPMTDNLRRHVALMAALFLLALAVACSAGRTAAPTKSEVTIDPNLYNVDHPELFKLAKVGTQNLPTLLNANGAVTPDVNRNIHVTSQGSGRVVDLRVKLGDSVEKGQVLLTIYSADLTGAFSDYQKAQADERLSKKALERAQLLYSHGALAQKDLEAAQDTEDKAKVDVQNTQQHVRLLGGDPAQPSSIIELRAAVSGTIVEQNVSGFEGIKSLDNSPNLFTIADLSQVWVVCDVYENDLNQVRLGDSAELRLAAYPGQVYHGKVANISRVLDPNLRSAKVRIVLPNPNRTLRPNMYAVATFRSSQLRPRLVVPTTAVMRLQDKDWVFRKESPNQFRKIEVLSSGATSDGLQELQDGAVKTGDEIVVNALEFSTAMAETKE